MSARIRDMEIVSKARVYERSDYVNDVTQFWFEREAPWGEKVKRGFAMRGRQRDCTTRADETEFLLHAAREAGRALDADIEKIHSERIAKGLSVGKVSSAGVGLPPWEVEPLWLMPPPPVSKAGKKKVPVTDKTVAAAKEEHDMMTASETFDQIKDVLARLNVEAQPAYRGSVYEAEIWCEVLDDTFENVQLVSEEEYSFERVIYSERQDSIVVVMAPVNPEEKTVFIPVTDMEDAFPELYGNLSRMVSPYSNLRSLDADARALTKGRVTFKKALGEASYASLGAATKLVAEKKQNETAAFYDANPIYGLL